MRRLPARVALLAAAVLLTGCGGVAYATPRCGLPNKPACPTPTASPSATVSPTPTVTASASATPTASYPAPSGFVTRSGQQLMLDGQPYRMLGFNLWRANISFALPNTGYLVNNGTVLDDSLTAINANSGRKNTIRAWFFQQLVTPTAAGYDWAPFDKTLQVAAAHGFKVIATLADQWSYEGPPVKDYSWYAGGYRTSVYDGTVNGVSYNENVPYRQYVADVVARYKDDPTIAAWELVNEAEDGTSSGCPADAGPVMQAFASDVGGLIHSLDANHLVSLGGGGNGNCGTLEGDYGTLVAIPELDVCSFHDYYGATNAGATDTYNGLNVRVQQCAAVGKPIVVGEVGIKVWDSNVGGDLTKRAAYLRDKMTAQFADQGVVGFVPWEWDSRVPPSSPCCATDYRYGIGDPALPVMDSFGL